MNPIYRKALQPAKKRSIDPNAPPRPNLLSHEKTIKGIKNDANESADLIRQLLVRVSQLESKVRQQASYMDTFHQWVKSKLK